MRNIDDGEKRKKEKNKQAGAEPCQAQGKFRLAFHEVLAC